MQQKIRKTNKEKNEEKYKELIIKKERLRKYGIFPDEEEFDELYVI
jgi:hypothetical protein